MMDVKGLSGLTLAYMGDSVYEVFVREHLIKKGVTKPNMLHQKATKYVSAKAQAGIMDKLLHEQLLFEDEVLVYKRGRNAKSYTSAKNADIVTYRVATGFETLIGYLFLNNKVERLNQIYTWCIKFVEKNDEI